MIADMSEYSATLRIRWAKMRQIQPPPPIGKDQFRVVEEAFLEKDVKFEGPAPLLGSTYVIRIDEVSTSDHTIEAVEHVEDANGTAQLVLTLSDWDDHGDDGMSELAKAGFVEV